MGCNGPTTERLVALYEATEAQLGVLRGVVRPHAERRPDEPVPPAMLATARAVLEAVRRVASREPLSKRLMQLPSRCSNADLATALGFAQVALARFHEQHQIWDSEERTFIWDFEEWQ